LPYYESVFIARQDISASQADALAETFEKVIADGGGSVSKRENWGLRTMAYKIKKNRKGHYVLLNIDAPATAVHEMERQMRINEDILRYMTVRVDELEAGPSAIMRNRDRDDRPRRDRGDRGLRRDHDDSAPRRGADDDAGSDSDSKDGDEA
jgi:small subunit ribosomal protein S6